MYLDIDTDYLINTKDIVGIFDLDNTTTTTSSSATSTASDRKYGHWFTTDGRVCSYTTSAGILAEWYPDQYGCYVGQYPGKLTRGKTYTIRQAFIYKDAANKEYRATMVVNLLVN
jgi:hypothetical protein